MNVLFWNLQRKNLSKIILEICQEQNVDLIALAEPQGIDEVTIKNQYRKIDTFSNIKIYTKYSKAIAKTVHEGHRFSIIEINSPISGKILLCVVHLISPINSSSEGRVLESQLLMQEIRRIRLREKTEHTIIFGDFNQNPYDTGIVAGACFNSTSDRIVAKKMRRIIQGNPYDYFYNPMWKFYASNERPHGTFFYRSSDHVVINWNILDQFLISSSLIDFINDADFKILSKTSKYPLIRRSGNVDYKNFSDHLPILMTAKI